MAASPNTPTEEYVEVAKLYHELLLEYWGQFAGTEDELHRQRKQFASILSDPDALRLKSSCYLLYRDLREELGGLQPQQFGWVNQRIRSRFGSDTPYVIGRGQA